MTSPRREADFVWHRAVHPRADQEPEVLATVYRGGRRLTESSMSPTSPKAQRGVNSEQASDLRDNRQGAYDPVGKPEEARRFGADHPSRQKSHTCRTLGP